MFVFVCMWVGIFLCVPNLCLCVCVCVCVCAVLPLPAIKTIDGK